MKSEGIEGGFECPPTTTTFTTNHLEMKKLLRLLVAIFFGIAAFVLIKQKTAVAPTDDMVGIPNPASAFCIEH